MGVVFAAQGVPLMVQGDWPGEDGTGVRGRLACGHFGEIWSEGSSTWNHPGEEQGCPEGCGLRQFDLRLQLALMDGTL